MSRRLEEGPTAGKTSERISFKYKASDAPETPSLQVLDHCLRSKQCHAITCQLQVCLKRADYDQRKCVHLLAAYHDCCTAYAVATLTAAPLSDAQFKEQRRAAARAEAAEFRRRR